MNRFWKRSYGEVSSLLIKVHGRGKGEDFFTKVCHNDPDEADYVLEQEINDMKPCELLDLMEEAGIVKVPDGQ